MTVPGAPKMEGIRRDEDNVIEDEFVDFEVMKWNENELSWDIAWYPSVYLKPQSTNLS